jgi:hypothetical protein
MGAFYVNYTVKLANQQSVVKALAGRTAFVSPEQSGAVVIFDQQSDNQDQTEIAELAMHLSTSLRCTVLQSSFTIAISFGISFLRTGSSATSTTQRPTTGPTNLNRQIRKGAMQHACALPFAVASSPRWRTYCVLQRRLIRTPWTVTQTWLVL